MVEARKRRGGNQRAAIKQAIQAGFEAVKEKNVDDAINIFATVLEENPNIAIAHVGLGRAFAVEGDHQKALEHFQEALTLDPELAPALIASGQSHEELGDTDLALADYEEALTVDPGVSRGQMRVTRLLEKEGRLDDAERYLKDAIARAPQEVSLRMLLAGVYGRAENTEAAEEQLARAADLRPDMWIAHYKLGRSLLQRKDFAGAEESLAKAVGMARDKSVVQFALAAAYAGQEKFAEAAKHYSEAHRLNPKMIRAAVDAAACKSRLGKHKEALDDLNKLKLGRRQKAVVQKPIGDIYVAMDRFPEAVEYYRAAALNGGRDGDRSDALQHVLDNENNDPRKLALEYKRAFEDRAAELRSTPGLARDRRAARRMKRAS